MNTSSFSDNCLIELKKSLYPKCIERNVAFDIVSHKTVAITKPKLISYVGYYKFDDHWGMYPAFEIDELICQKDLIFFIFAIQCSEQDVSDLKSFRESSPIYDHVLFYIEQFVHEAGKFLTVDNFPTQVNPVFKQKTALELIHDEKYINILNLGDTNYEFNPGLYGNMLYVRIIIARFGEIMIEVNSSATKYYYDEYDIAFYAIPSSDIQPQVAVDLLYSSVMKSLGCFFPYSSCTFNNVDF